MAHNAQPISDGNNPVRPSTEHTRSEDLAPQIDTLKVVSCPICQAIYIPSTRQSEDAPDAPTLLETAFLRVCHFCLHCQRPACPQCWDQEHNLCSICSKAARLPFRTPLSSFEGLIFSPPLLPQMQQNNYVSFTCLRNGQLYLPDQKSPTVHEPAMPPHQYLPDQSPRRPAHADDSYPDWLQEIMGQYPNYQQQICKNSTSKIIHTEQPLLLPQTTSREQPHNTQMHLPVNAPSLPPLYEQSTAPNEETLPAESTHDPEKSTLIERTENILIFLTSFVLVALILMIVAAICSSNVNILFSHLLHIDIRAEISYLLQLL